MARREAGARREVGARREAGLVEVVAVALGGSLIAALLADAWQARLAGAGLAPGNARPGGVQAATPLQIPARGWWHVLRRVAVQFNEHRLMTEAAGITFFALLSIFPAIAAVVSIYGLFADPAVIEQHLAGLRGVLPGGGMDIVGEQVTRLAGNSGGALGAGVAVGILTSLWSANQGTKAMFDALNVVFDEREKRGYLRRTALSLALTLGGIIATLLALAAVLLAPIALSFIGFGTAGGVALNLLRWPLLILVIGVLLAVIYRYGPSRVPARWQWVSWGSGVATIVWLLGSAGFSWYVANFGSYNKTYGSLGAAVGFMTWIWLSAMVVLLGAELDAELEHQTTEDTTTGPSRPRGARGATKADQVAA